ISTPFNQNYVQTSGTTDLQGGSLAPAGSGIVDIPGGTLGGDGTILANVTSSGRVAPGHSAATLNIQGNYTQTAAGDLRIELGGITPGTQFDVLTITGSA